MDGTSTTNFSSAEGAPKHIRSKSITKPNFFQRAFLSLWGRNPDNRPALVHSISSPKDERETPFKKFTYVELEKATKSFSRDKLLGKGTKGSVYRGSISLNAGLEKIDVAIKQFDAGQINLERDYSDEIKIIKRLNHPNVVPLLGWCHEPGHFLLVYEFMSKKDLGSHLNSKGQTLPWNVRYSKVAMGIARALLYLQEGWDDQQCVIHRDIKPSNILLDADFNPKLTDFEVARLVYDHTLVSTLPVTKYTDPKHLNGTQLTKESDIYSFGVIALELACGCSNESIVHAIHKKKNEGALALLELVDPKLGNKFDQQEMQRLLWVGMLCTEHTDRASIRQVLRILSLNEDPKFAISDNDTHSASMVHQSSEGGRHADNSSLTFVLTGPTMMNCTFSLQTHPSNQSSTDREEIARSTTDHGVHHMLRIDEEDGDIGIQNLPIEETFDIGIPPGYESIARLTESDRPIVNGVVASLQSLLSSDALPQFEDVLQLIKRNTAILTMVGAPLSEWNIISQHILQAFKAIDSLNTKLKSEFSYPKLAALSMPSLRDRRDETATVIRGEEARLKALKEELSSTQEQRSVLVAQLEKLRKQTSDIEQKIADTEEKIMTTEQSRSRHQEMQEQEEILLKRFKLISSKLSSFSSGD